MDERDSAPACDGVPPGFDPPDPDLGDTFHSLALRAAKRGAREPTYLQSRRLHQCFDDVPGRIPPSA